MAKLTVILLSQSQYVAVAAQTLYSTKLGFWSMELALAVNQIARPGVDQDRAVGAKLYI